MEARVETGDDSPFGWWSPSRAPPPVSPKSSTSSSDIPQFEGPELGGLDPQLRPRPRPRPLDLAATPWGLAPVLGDLP